MEISVRELKNHLSGYLRRAQAGEEIIVTSHGKAIARLSAALRAGPDPASPEDIAHKLEQAPWAIPPRQRGHLEGSDRPTAVPPGTTDEIMRRIRGE